jgi:hypothetical protein
MGSDCWQGQSAGQTFLCDSRGWHKIPFSAKVCQTVQKQAQQEEHEERMLAAAGLKTASQTVDVPLSNSESPEQLSRTGSPSSRRCDACDLWGYSTRPGPKSVASARVKQLREVAWKEALVDAVAEADASRPLNPSSCRPKLLPATPMRGRPCDRELPSRKNAKSAAYKQVQQPRLVHASWSRLPF